MTLDALFTLAQVWAASSAGANGHSAPISDLIFPLINFLIFLYLIKRFLMPLIKGHLHSRREQILGAVQSAEEGKQRADAALQDYRGRLARMDGERKKIIETLRAEGERGKAKLLREAEEFTSKIRADADFVAQQEAKVARQQIREEIARIAQAAAEKAIKTNLGPSDQERLFDQFLVGIVGTK